MITLVLRIVVRTVFVHTSGMSNLTPRLAVALGLLARNCGNSLFGD
jgi:hypothetical protein